MRKVEGGMFVDDRRLLEVLLHQREHGVGDSVYKMVQCDFAYNSNHMEGSRLTPEQTRMVFGRKAISGEDIPLDDILEAMNHFEAFDLMLDWYDRPIDADMLFTLHRTLKANTSQARDPVYSVGAYKLYANVIGTLEQPTTPPDEVPAAIDGLLAAYERGGRHSFDELLDFHVSFERIHPFSDGNGRVGRLIMFKECLRNGVMPFIVTDDLHGYYIRGIQNYGDEKGWLRDTCLAAQDRFMAKYLPLAESYADAMAKARVEPTVSLKREREAATAASHDSDLNRSGADAARDQSHGER